LGLEPTSELYIRHLCDIFDEVKRVLKKTGTVWINFGDSYGGNAQSNWNVREDYPEEKKTGGFHSKLRKEPWDGNLIKGPAKSLVGIPEMFVLEMKRRGWIRRNTIIWWKPNCMPSSTQDRFTVDFEYLYFFTKSQRYFFERQFEPHTESTKERSKYHWCKSGNKASEYQNLSGLNRDEEYPLNPQGRNKRTVWQMTKEEYLNWQAEIYDTAKALMEAKGGSVWKITTEAFKEAHFATFPSCPG
jgi:hypothetical protein